jgi:uncharacterized protein (DUF983 family)
MFHRDEADASSHSDPLTIIIVGVLTLLAAAGTVFLVVYAIWWLVTFWAPA